MTTWKFQLGSETSAQVEAMVLLNESNVNFGDFGKLPSEREN